MGQSGSRSEAQRRPSSLPMVSILAVKKQIDVLRKGEGGGGGGGGGVGGRASTDIKGDIKGLKDLLELGQVRSLEEVVELDLVGVVAELLSDSGLFGEDREEVIGLSCSVLLWLVSRAGEEEELLVRVSTSSPSLLISIVKLLPSVHPQVQARILNILSKLAYAEGNRAQLGRKALGLVPILMELVREFKTDIRMLSCQILNYLSMSNGNRLGLMSATTGGGGGGGGEKEKKREEEKKEEIVNESSVEVQEKKEEETEVKEEQGGDKEVIGKEGDGSTAAASAQADSEAQGTSSTLPPIITTTNTNNASSSPPPSPSSSAPLTLIQLMKVVIEEDRGPARSFACSILANLAASHTHSSISAESEDALLRVITSLLETVKQVEKSADLKEAQSQILGFLINITSSSETSETVSANRKYLLMPQFDLLQHLINIIRIEKDELRAKGSTLLWNLSIEPSNQPAMADPELGLVYALSYVLKDDTGVARVSTCRTLRNLAASKSNHDHLLCSDLNIMPIIVEIINEDRSYACVNLCAFISILAEEISNIKALVCPDYHMYSTLVNVSKRGKGDQRLHSCKALFHMSSVFENKSEMLSPSHGLVSAVAQVISEDKTEARAFACGTIYNLILDFDDRIIASSRGVQSTYGHELLGGMVRLLASEASERSRHYVLRSLYHLSLSVGNRSVMATFPDLLLVLVKVLKTGGLTEEEVMLILGVLYNFSLNSELRQLFTSAARSSGSQMAQSGSVPSSPTKEGASAAQTHLSGDILSNLMDVLRHQLMSESATDPESNHGKLKMFACGLLSNFSSSNMLYPQKELLEVLIHLLENDAAKDIRMQAELLQIIYNFLTHEKYLTSIGNLEHQGQSVLLDSIVNAISNGKCESSAIAIKVVWLLSIISREGILPESIINLLAFGSDRQRLDAYTALWNLSEDSNAMKNAQIFVKNNLQKVLLDILGGKFGDKSVTSTEEHSSMILGILINFSVYSTVSESIANLGGIGTILSLIKRSEGIIQLKAKVLLAFQYTDDMAINESAITPIVEGEPGTETVATQEDSISILIGEVFKLLVGIFVSTLRSEGSYEYEHGTFSINVILCALLALAGAKQARKLYISSGKLVTSIIRVIDMFVSETASITNGCGGGRDDYLAAARAIDLLSNICLLAENDDELKSLLKDAMSDESTGFLYFSSSVSPAVLSSWLYSCRDMPTSRPLGDRARRSAGALAEKLDSIY